MQLVLVIDNVRSKENIGALFRTADGAGVMEVVLCGISPCPTNRFGNADGKIAKSALGAESSVSWRHAADCSVVLRELHQDGFMILALEQTPTSVLFTPDIRGSAQRVAVVVGNEVTGVSSNALSCAHVVAHLPMLGVKESLNVTTAAGIALYSFVLRSGSTP